MPPLKTVTVPRGPAQFGSPGWVRGWVAADVVDPSASSGVAPSEARVRRRSSVVCKWIASQVVTRPAQSIGLDPAARAC